MIGNFTIINNAKIYSNLRNGIIFDSKRSNNLINNSNISLNAFFGILMNGVNDTFQSSNILKNIINSINITGTENKLIYNRITKMVLICIILVLIPLLI
ncbi:hypothetical protein ALNOE001_05300 [Candidatus Methanobinarius endosymbioticus]|uniref:Uncharacterized protein n=1 Tax=Candidatus Methanobinarius endosymbioticus TaxID=2006182 RepID=A0A366MDU9_9EURY|nr:hypothetical protein ALNOE001_05300 [Candidatus Methanobinarius endosymbioticus]